MLYYKHANKPICEQSNACTKSNSKHSRQQTTNSGPAEHMLAEQKLPKHREAITKQTTCTRFPVKYITTQKFRQISCDYHSTFSTGCAQVALCSYREMQNRADASTTRRRHTRFECTLRLLVRKFKGHELITESPKHTAIIMRYGQGPLNNFDEFEYPKLLASVISNFTATMFPNDFFFTKAIQLSCRY